MLGCEVPEPGEVTITQVCVPNRWPCGTALLLFPASVGFVVLANWVWNKVSAVTQPVASAGISGTQGEVGVDDAHDCNMINHNYFLNLHLFHHNSFLLITGFTAYSLICFT